VLTGETGAGKTIVVEALGLAAGDRADGTLLRSGAERATVEAAFDAPWPAALAALLEARGLEFAADGLVARRDVPASGSSRVFLNGSPATLAVLREAGDLLVELHGQHEHQSLLSAETHLDLLDEFGEHAGPLRAVAGAWRAAEDARQSLASLRAAALERESRLEILRATVREVQAVAPRAGELAELDRERRILQNAGKIAQLVDESVELLYDGDPSAASLASGAARRAAELAAVDPSLADPSARLEACRLELQDLGATLRAYRDGARFDPARLEGVEARRVAIERLLLRHGPEESDALRAGALAAAGIAALEDVERGLAAAETALAGAHAAYAEAAERLGAGRRAAAARHGPAVEAQLRALALDKARFEVALTRGREGARGWDRAEFLLAANPGEPPKPLSRTASGGELSRTMLALHVVLEGAGRGRTIVFDEVDAGVGGAVAAAVGARLAQMARRHQVLCVTHLPQVAAHAERHYHVRKRVADGRTRTEVVRLDDAERVEELARMLGGLQPSAAARRNAAELLEEAAAARSGPRSKTRRTAP
jgi:DNA repair protein RecN (Recombination protein N)